MLKKKYLHRKSRNSRYTHGWDVKKFKRGKNLDFFSDKLPLHQRMGGSNWSNYDNTPLYEFIKSKIGKDWNDVYSEIVSKTKKKFRWNIDFSLQWMVHKPLYDGNFIPRDLRGRILSDVIYIDMNNILVKKTKEEILIESKALLRREKLKKIMENQEKEQEE